MTLFETDSLVKLKSVRHSVCKMNDVIKLEEEVSSLMKEMHLLEAIKLMNGQLSIVKENWELSWNLGWCYFSIDRFN